MMLKIDDIVRCEPNGNLTKPFVGRIEKFYERTALVCVLGHHDCDRWKVIELTGRVIVALSKLSPAVVTPHETSEVQIEELLKEA